MITHDDLEWWLATAPSLQWTFASTYAETAPHEYVVLGRSRCPLSRAAFVRAAKVIATFGEPAKFRSMTGIYLTSPDGRLKWWTMDAQLDDTDLINQATTERVYGRQDAPITRTPAWVPDDALAADYDRSRDTASDDAVRDLVRAAFPGGAATTLDIGCGTGRLLDLGVVDPSRWTGVDHSHAMLNMLVRKHPRVGRLVAAAWSPDVVAGATYDLVVALDGPEVEIGDLQALSSGVVITSRRGVVEMVRGTSGAGGTRIATVDA